MDTDPARLSITIADKERTKKDSEIAIRATQANVASVDSSIYSFICIDPCDSTSFTAVNLPNEIKV